MLTFWEPQTHQQLMDAALKHGVKLEAGQKVVAVDVEKTAITLDDGRRISADLIIASDGVHSMLRGSIVEAGSKQVPRASTGHNAFRFMLPTSTVREDKVMASVVEDDVRMYTWAGLGKRILVYPVDFDKQFNITCTHPEKESDKDAQGNGDDAIGESSMYCTF
jgi:salicylate hydroxylase